MNVFRLRRLYHVTWTVGFPFVRYPRFMSGFNRARTSTLCGIMKVMQQKFSEECGGLSSIKHMSEISGLKHGEFFVLHSFLLNHKMYILLYKKGSANFFLVYVGIPLGCILSIFVPKSIFPHISNELAKLQTELSTIEIFRWFFSILHLES